MEVKLDKRYPVDASVAQSWAVLSDIHATAACMPGAQITEQIDATHFKGTVKSRIGPASMSFNGDIELLGLDAGKRELRMLGKGADRGGSSASMELLATVEPGESAGQSVLAGTATILVSGKLAQFGNRLLVPVSDAMLAQFADNFRAAAQAIGAAAPAAADAGDTTIARMVQQGEAPGAVGDAAATPAAPAPVIKELNVFGLIWAVIRGWIAGLFGRRS
jgi:carbon monoxide dehydrogenase subunit G